MKNPDDQLGMPGADELWPAIAPFPPDVKPTAVDAGTSGDPEPAPAADDAMWNFDSPRPAAVLTAVKPFPVAPPIPPLSFSVAESAVEASEPQPVPAVAEAPWRDSFRVEEPLPSGSEWPTIPTLAPVVPAHAPILRAKPAAIPEAVMHAEAPVAPGHEPILPRHEPISPAVAPRPSPVQTIERAAPIDRVGSLGPEGLEAVLRAAAARGASTVYVHAGTEMSARVNGELQTLEGNPVLGSDAIEMMLVSLKLAHHTDARRMLTSSEWSFDLPDVAQVRCTTFRDHRGAGAVFGIVPFHVPAAEQIGLSLDVQQLAVEREGLIIVAGPRASGKLRLMHQLANLITRSRHAYVIAVQRGAGKPDAQESGSISQREVRDGLDDMLDVARSALRENPDVLVLQEARSAPLMNLALDAAASGQLVIAGFTAPTALDALEGILALYPTEEARSVQLRLAQHVRGLVGQVLVPKAHGGRIVAQEVLLITPPVAAVLSEGQTWQLRAALQASATYGMVPLSDVLVDLVRTGEVRPEDAYRHAPDRPGLLDRFKRYGIDTSFAPV